MKILSLLYGSCGVLAATVSGSLAADAVVAPEPESVEYVRVCDAYGAGYFYIPGTETCLRISGYVRYDVKGGDDAYRGLERGGWDKNGRFALRTHTASETELGTLKTFTETRFNFGSRASGDDGVYGKQSQNVDLHFAYIQLGGFKVGIDDSEFISFTGYLGDVINDDVISGGSETTGKISYTFTSDNGFSAVIAVEEGGDDSLGYSPVVLSNGKVVGGTGDYVVDEYAPHVVAGLKFEQGWGKIAAVAAYDAVLEEWAGKIRGDVNVTDRFSLWLQGGYSSEETDDQNYGQWGGEWAVWGGAKFKATEKAIFNVQAAYEDWGKTAVTANVAYELVPGFTITPEVSYTKWESDHPRRVIGQVGDEAWEGMVRFQRSF